MNSPRNSWGFAPALKKGGGPGTGKNVIHRYQYPGDYIVALSVTDNDGAVGNNDIKLIITFRNVVSYSQHIANFNDD